MATIEERIKKIIATNLGDNPANIKGEMKLVDDLGADSLDKVEMVMELEDEFVVDIPDEDGERWVTVQDVVDYVTKLQDASSEV